MHLIIIQNLWFLQHNIINKTYKHHRLFKHTLQQLQIGEEPQNKQPDIIKIKYQPMDNKNEKNLPKLHKPNQILANPQINTHLYNQNIHPINPHNQRKLSPFTWSNIKLPPVTKSLLNIEEESFIKLKQIKQKKQSKKHDQIHKKTKQNKIQTNSNEPQTQKQKQKQSQNLKNQSTQKTKFNATQGLKLFAKKNFDNTQQYKSIQMKNQKSQRKNTRYSQKEKSNFINIINRSTDIDHLPTSLNRSIQSKPSNSENTKNNFLYLTSKLREYQLKSSQMEPYIRNVLVANNWVFTKNPKYQPSYQNRQNNAKPQNTLIWTKNQINSIYNDMKPWQFYNHIEGSFNLTMKDKLHQQLAHKIDCKFYPKSYFLNKEYQNFIQQYDSNVVKSVIKVISSQIKSFFEINKKYKLNQQTELQQISLSEILDDIIKERNQEDIKLIRLCLFIDNYIKLNKTRMIQYFQRFSSYRKVHVTLTQTMYSNVIQWCLNYINNYHEKITLKNQQNYNQNHSYDDNYGINLQNIDYRILILILHFDKMLKLYQQDYLYEDLSYHNVWIGKPFGSSRGAGIFIIKDSAQFHKIRQNFIHQLKTRSKFQNKIIQKYIEKPLILKSEPQYKDRKFDIRQWVLVISGQRPNQKFIYRYHDAYCRFSSKNYNLQSNNLQVHLTNYELVKKNLKKQNNNETLPYIYVSEGSNDSVNKNKESQRKRQSQTIPSVLMLSKLFKMKEIKQKNVKFEKIYTQIIDNIIHKTVGSSKLLKYKQGTFELFGFDVMFDEKGNLFLLQINLNPKCSSQRDQFLKVQAQRMVQSMFELIFYGAQKNNSNFWIPLFSQKINKTRNDQFQFKPSDFQNTMDQEYFGISKQQSLMEYVSNRRRSILDKYIQILTNYQKREGCKLFFQNLASLKSPQSLQQKQKIQKVQENEQNNINSNKVQNIQSKQPSKQQKQQNEAKPPQLIEQNQM